MTADNLTDSISRLTALIRDFGPEKNPQFIADITAVLEAARKYESNCNWRMDQPMPSGVGSPEYDAMAPLINRLEQCQICGKIFNKTDMMNLQPICRECY